MLLFEVLWRETAGRVMEEVWPDQELRSKFTISPQKLEIKSIHNGKHFTPPRDLQSSIPSVYLQLTILHLSKKGLFFKGQYIPKNPVSRVIQCAAVASENEVKQMCMSWIFKNVLKNRIWMGWKGWEGGVKKNVNNKKEGKVSRRFGKI